MKVCDAKKHGKKSHAQAGVVALKLALDIEKPDTKHVNFQECIKGVSQKSQDGISMLIKGKEPQVFKSPYLYHGRVFLDSCSTFIQMADEILLSNARESEAYLYDFFNTGHLLPTPQGQVWT